MKETSLFSLPNLAGKEDIKAIVELTGLAFLLINNTELVYEQQNCH